MTVDTIVGWKNAAEKWNVCEKTLRNYVRKYGMPKHSNPAGTATFRISEVDAWMVSGPPRKRKRKAKNRRGKEGDFCGK